MALELNTECCVCGKKYHVCNTCKDIVDLKPWRSVTDTIEHYKIYLAIHGYTIYKNKESAKKELENCDLSGLENFNPEIKSVIEKIMTGHKKNTVLKKSKNILEAETKKDNDIE